MKSTKEKFILAGTLPRIKRSPCRIDSSGSCSQIVTEDESSFGVVNSGPQKKINTDRDWTNVIGRRRSRRRQWLDKCELRKIIVFGIHRHLELWYITKLFSLNTEEVFIKKIVAENNCRIELLFESAKLRDMEYDNIKTIAKNKGWHIVNGRTFKMRELQRNGFIASRLRSSKNNKPNYYECLSVLDNDIKLCKHKLEECNTPNISNINRFKCKSVRRRRHNKHNNRKNKKCISSQFVIASLNCQGITNKIPEIYEILSKKYKADIIAVSETWLKNDTTVNMDKFKFYGRNRKLSGTSGKKGHGGIGFFVRQYLVQYIHVLDFPSFDGVMFIKIKEQGKTDLFIGCVYAPTCTANKKQIEDVYNELESLVQELKTKGDVILLGDFNARIGNNNKVVGALMKRSLIEMA